MKTSEVIGLGAIGLVAFMFFSKARSLATLQFFPGNIGNIYLDGSTPVIELSLIVQNTSSSGFVLESLAGTLTCDDKLVANFSNFSPVNINANSQVTVPVTVRLMLIGIVNQIISAFTGATSSKKIRMQGFANAGFVRAPIDVSFTVGSPLN